MLIVILLAMMASTPQPDAAQSVSVRVSIGAWMDEHARTIEAPTVRPRIRWEHARTKTAIYVGLFIGDLASTEWSVRTPAADGTVYHEGNPLPGMGTTTGRAILLPAMGLGVAQVDRLLSIHGHIRWARAWRWAWWVGEALQILANLRITPYWATPGTILVPGKRDK